MRSTKWWRASAAKVAKKSVVNCALASCARDLGAVALGDAGDDRFLGREIAIDVAGAHPGLGADLLHRGLVKAHTGKAAPRRVEDFRAAVGMQLGVGLTQGIPPDLACCNAA